MSTSDERERNEVLRRLELLESHLRLMDRQLPPDDLEGGSDRAKALARLRWLQHVLDIQQRKAGGEWNH